MIDLENKIHSLKIKYYTVVIFYGIGIALFSSTLYLYMELNSILLDKYKIGHTWVILAVIGVILMLIFSSQVKRTE